MHSEQDPTDPLLAVYAGLLSRCERMWSHLTSQHQPRWGVVAVQPTHPPGCCCGARAQSCSSQGGKGRDSCHPGWTHVLGAGGESIEQCHCMELPAYPARRLIDVLSSSGSRSSCCERLGLMSSPAASSMLPRLLLRLQFSKTADTAGNRPWHWPSKHLSGRVAQTGAPPQPAVASMVKTDLAGAGAGGACMASIISARLLLRLAMLQASSPVLDKIAVWHLSLHAFADELMHYLWLLVTSTGGPCIASSISARLLFRRVMLQERATFEAGSPDKSNKQC